jgi:hypothetical protein
MVYRCSKKFGKSGQNRPCAKPHPAREVCPKNAYKFRTIFPLGIIALALSGCATTRYTQVYCLTPPQLEKLKQVEPEHIADRLTGQAQDDFKLVAGSAVELRQYSADLLNVLSNCTEPSR